MREDPQVMLITLVSPFEIRMFIQSVGNGLSFLDVHTPCIMVPAKISSVSLSAKPVEKVQMANSDNFGTIKNQELTGRRKP